MNNITLHKYDSRAELDQALSQTIAQQLEQALNRSERVSAAFSGGSTPKGLFEKLSSRELNWPAIDVTLVDDRLVDQSHDDSNERLVKAAMLRDKAAAARFVSLADQVNPEAAEPLSQFTAAQIQLPLSLAVLGMGGDGHTASWFPDAPELAQALAPAADEPLILTTPQQAPHKRITFTLPAILAADVIHLHICGQDKMTVLQQAMEPGSVESLPIRAVLQQTQTPVDIHWAP